MPDAITLFVPGRPAPQGSKRHVGNGIMIESSKAVKPWRIEVMWAAREACPAPINGAAAVRLDFVMPRPKSAPKRSTPPAIKRPDLDKIARAVLDAITGVIVADDSQVVDLHATKRIAEIGETPGVHITARHAHDRPASTHSASHADPIPEPTPPGSSPAERHTATKGEP